LRTSTAGTPTSAACSAYRAHPLPGYKPSRKVLRFTIADIDQWLRSAAAPRDPQAYAGTGRQRARRIA